MLANTGFVSLSVAHDPPTTFHYPSKLTLPLASVRAGGGTRGLLHNLQQAEDSLALDIAGLIRVP